MLSGHTIQFCLRYRDVVNIVEINKSDYGEKQMKPKRSVNVVMMDFLQPCPVWAQ
jgi:hypothetical protein